MRQSLLTFDTKDDCFMSQSLRFEFVHVHLSWKRNIREVGQQILLLVVEMEAFNGHVFSEESHYTTLEVWVAACHFAVGKEGWLKIISFIPAAQWGSTSKAALSGSSYVPPWLFLSFSGSHKSTTMSHAFCQCHYPIFFLIMWTQNMASYKARS